MVQMNKEGLAQVLNSGASRLPLFFLEKGTAQLKQQCTDHMHHNGAVALYWRFSSELLPIDLQSATLQLNAGNIYQAY